MVYNQNDSLKSLKSVVLQRGYTHRGMLGYFVVSFGLPTNSGGGEVALDIHKPQPRS